MDSGRKSGLWFLRLPTHAELDTVFLEQDRLLVVLPEGHPLAEYPENSGECFMRGTVYAVRKRSKSRSFGNF